ncbi:MAG: YbjN domain-containing protein [Saprospiraceae bacterium]|nr:YbjN domain-containing protein [Saprospiraceae bacterium]
MSNFDKVQGYILELGYDLVEAMREDNILILNNEEKGIYNMVLDCEGDVLVLEQIIMKVEGDNPETYKKLLQINRNLVHGAFVADTLGETILFRDTLELENLDLNELEGSINSLALGLLEYMDDLLAMAPKAEA